MEGDKEKLNFNSIKVRLEHTNYNTSNTDSEFQFHKGTIRTQAFSALLDTHLHFNSIKVRLERVNLFVKEIELCGFQFHKGTIRTI